MTGHGWTPDLDEPARTRGERAPLRYQRVAGFDPEPWDGPVPGWRAWVWAVAWVALMTGPWVGLAFLVWWLRGGT